MDNIQLILTGYTGFIGSNLLKTFKEHDNFKIHLLGRKKESGFSWSYLSLDNSEFNFELPPTNLPRVLIHSASLMPNTNNTDFNAFEQGERRFLEQCLKANISKVIYISTGGVYGNRELAKETDPIVFTNDYVKAKINGEQLVKYLWPNNHVIIRCFFPYGNGQELPRLLPGLIAKINNNETINIQGNDGLLINPVYINDLVEAILFLVENNHQGTFNLAGRNCITLKELIKKISNYLKCQPNIATNNESNSVMTGNVDKILKINPSLLATSIDEGLLNTLDKFTIK